MSELGADRGMTIETNTTVYTLGVDLYTMIIDSPAELDQWQEVAADTAIRAGLCIEQQKGLVTTGYFLLGSDIDYDKNYVPYKTYSEYWHMLNTDGTIGNTLIGVEGAILGPDWGDGSSVGFRGIFDGRGHNIDGLSVTGQWNGFILTTGNSAFVKNI